MSKSTRNMPTKATTTNNSQGNQGNQGNQGALVGVNPTGPQYITQVVKDENGLIAIGKLNIEAKNEAVEDLKLTASSYERAIRENIVSSSIPTIDEQLKLSFESATLQARQDLKQHMANRLGELNEIIGNIKSSNINMQNEILAQRKELSDQARSFNSSIDIYNLGGSSAYSTNTITAVVVEDEDEEQQFI